MPRLKSITSGVVVSVSDATASLLGAGWVAAVVAPTEAKRVPVQPTKIEN